MCVCVSAGREGSITAVGCVSWFKLDHENVCVPPFHLCAFSCSFHFPGTKMEPQNKYVCSEPF